MKIKHGIVYVKEKGKVKLHKSLGLRDFSNELPNTKDTSFPTASMGKIFTAIGILKLIEEHKLSLFTPIGNVLSFHLHNIDPQVTIQELLSHTSGVPDYADEELVPDYAQLWKDYPNYKIRESKDLLPLFIKEPMKYKRGLRFEYNNSGFVLLGLIIEEITKQSIDSYLDELIFKPLKMRNTGYYSLDSLPKNTALGHIGNKDSYHTFIYSIDAKGSGAGGCFTNPTDLDKFWSGLFQHKLIKKELVAKMISKQAEDHQDAYGLGVWLDKFNNPYIVGVDPGVTCISSYNVETKKQVTVISNNEENIWSLYNSL